ncbi:MAG: sigma-70 family RNA polymerase sigma factor [Verrucomicrobiota bacterium]
MSQSDPQDDLSRDPAESYLSLLNENERSLRIYVHSLVREHADAEDILQACRLTMWKQFSKFEIGTNFLAWARKIAFHQILNYRRSENRKPVYKTDPKFLEAVASEIDAQSDRLEARSAALRECLHRLPDQQRRTILLRYFEGCGIEEIATETGRTEGAVYRLLSRIRASLNECITNRLTTAK